MKFAAVSDTHDNLAAVRELVEALKKEKLDFVVHAGDVIAPFSLKEFEKLEVKLYIAFGNNDGDRRILTETANRNGWEIGDIVEFPGGVVYHGTDSRILEILKKLDTLVVFGHTHEALKSENLLNPGEVCGYLIGRKTYAIIEDGEISIVEL